MRQQDNRARLFIGNFIAFGIIGVMNYAIPIVMLPVVTRLLGNAAEYGRYDMFNTLVGFGGNIASIGIYDATFREYFEKDDPTYKSTVLAMSLKLHLTTAILVFFLVAIFSDFFSIAFLNDAKGSAISIYAAVAIFINSAINIYSTPMKLLNRKKMYVITGLLRSAVMYGSSVALLMSGFSYMGMIWSSIMSSLVLLVFYIITNGHFFNFSLTSKPVAKELLRLALPLAPVFLIYWVFNSMDKIMITHMLGLEQVGIYSVGAKLAMASQLIYMAFAGGWQYFAFSTMREKDQVAFNSKIFEYLGAISYGATFCAMLFDAPLFNLLFTGNYRMGSTVFPYLFLAPLLLMLYQTVGNQLLVIKKNAWFLIALLFGVVTNLGANFILIPVMGIKGAAFSTLIGYAMSVAIICVLTSKLGIFNCPPKFCFSSAYMLLVMLTEFLYGNVHLMFCLSIIGIIGEIVAYKRDIALLFSDFKTK